MSEDFTKTRKLLHDGDNETISSYGTNVGAFLPDHLGRPGAQQSVAGTKTFGNMNIDGSASVHNGDRIDLHTHRHYHVLPAHPGRLQLSRELLAHGDERAEILETLQKLLAFENITNGQHNIRTALPSTCLWLFATEAFRSWYDKEAYPQHQGFLWIKGRPGCGKSTLMKAALAWVNEHKIPSAWTLYYFFNARSPSILEKSSLGLYRSLVYQILEVTTESRLQSLEKLFISHFAAKTNINEEGASLWTETELQEFLIAVVKYKERPTIYLFIDALDEGSVDDVRSMISFLEELTDHAKETNATLNVCLSSRHYPHITIRKGLSLTVENEVEHDQDIVRYVHKKIVDVSQPAMRELARQVCSKSNGIFLWVVLVIPILNRFYEEGKGLKTMLKKLDEIPVRLERLFCEILRSDTRDLGMSVTLLQCALFAYESFDPSSIVLAAYYALQDEDQTVDAVDLVKNQQAVGRWILAHSRGLLEIVQYDEHVQFIHESVRQFLLGSYGLTSIVPLLAADLAGQSHVRLGTACLESLISLKRRATVPPYLDVMDLMSMDEFERDIIVDRLMERTPMLRYATGGLFWHVEQALSLHVPNATALSEDLIDFMIHNQASTSQAPVPEPSDCSTPIRGSQFGPVKILLTWLQLWHQMQDAAIEYPDKVTLLHILIDQHCYRLLELFLKRRH